MKTFNNQLYLSHVDSVAEIPDLFGGLRLRTSRQGSHALLITVSFDDHICSTRKK